MNNCSVRQSEALNNAVPFIVSHGPFPSANFNGNSQADSEIHALEVAHSVTNTDSCVLQALSKPYLLLLIVSDVERTCKAVYVSCAHGHLKII